MVGFSLLFRRLSQDMGGWRCEKLTLIEVSFGSDNGDARAWYWEDDLARLMRKCPDFGGLALIGVKSFPTKLARAIIKHDGLKTLQIAHSENLPISRGRGVPQLSDIEALIVRRGRLVRLQFDHNPAELSVEMIGALRKSKTIRQLIVSNPTKRFMSDIEHRVVLVNRSVKSIVQSNHVLTSVKGQCLYLTLHRILGINSSPIGMRDKMRAKLFLMHDTFLTWAKGIACEYDSKGRHQFIRCAVIAFLGGDGYRRHEGRSLRWMARAPLALVHSFVKENIAHLMPA